ncbi:hypothetical protein Pmani_020720 [Petrolisthes manimaculis]|uniref:Uncharacterized protein n=1 Tax=Petrolisthes manimaculis TaxID=1843537 RepID=A0AAE1PFM9_9EUCA|nr:hypothetical protein Pmani_020720 [Petrolisthes manimaculis]
MDHNTIKDPTTSQDNTTENLKYSTTHTMNPPRHIGYNKLHQTNTTKMGRCQMMTLLSSGDVTAVEGGHVRVGSSLKSTVPSSHPARPLSSHRDTR